MDARPILTSLAFDRADSRALIGQVVPREHLTTADRQRMYELMSTYFVGVRQSCFDADLAEKEAAVILRDRNTSEIQGFSTFMRLAVEVDGRQIVAFFSGDTIIAAQYWGERTLSRLWSQTIFGEADRIVATLPGTQVYWFLICSGYKTFRFLPVFFRRYFPNPEAKTPNQVQAILDTFGQAKFGALYDAASGIVRLQHATPLREGIADLTEQRLRDPLVAFFAGKNPGHTLGDELACITEISRANLTRAGERMIGSKQSPLDPYV